MKPTFSQSEFAERLFKQRNAAGYARQNDLAQAAGISAQSVSAYENGERLPSAEVLFSIACALGCTTDYLVQLEDTALRAHVTIGKGLGLTDKSLTCLRRYSAISSCGTEDEKYGKYGQDLINSILEFKDFDALVYQYSHLIDSFFALANEDSSPDSEKESIIKTLNLREHGMVAINSSDAVDYFVTHLSETIANVIRDSVERTFDDLTRRTHGEH